jgi:hypothetical protein
MTVAAAAICKNGNEGVLVGISDRMITSGDTEFESNTTKIFGFANARTVCLSAGDTDAAFEVATETHRQVLASKITGVGEIADLFASNHAALRSKRLERNLLAPLGLDLDTFVSRQQEMDPSLVAELAGKMLDESGDLGVEVIIAGVDSTGPHIYHICDPGVSVCRDRAAFWAIGSGARHFETLFMSAAYDFTYPLIPCLLLACAAKKQAERAPGVGKITDMLIAGKGGVLLFAQERMQAVQRHYEDMERKILQLRFETVQKMERDGEILPDAVDADAPKADVPT